MEGSCGEVLGSEPDASARRPYLPGLQPVEAGAEIGDFGAELLQRLREGLGEAMIGGGAVRASGGGRNSGRLQPALGGLFQHLGGEGGSREGGCLGRGASGDLLFRLGHPA